MVRYAPPIAKLVALALNARLHRQGMPPGVVGAFLGSAGVAPPRDSLTMGGAGYRVSRREATRASVPESEGAPWPASLKMRLRDEPGFKAYGAFLMSGSPLLAELLGHAGYGFLVVDLEHSPADAPQAVAMLQAAAAAQTPALIRVAQNRPELIKKALDLGPAGIVVPLVDTVEDAAAAAAACRYPPEGIRGVAYPLVRASAWGLDAKYLRESESRHLLLCQVESRTAVEQVEGILGTAGVDGVFVGPLDLSASLGHIGQTHHEEVEEALQRVEAAVARHPGKVLAGFAGGRPAAEMFAAGYRLVAGAVDLGLVRDAARADIAAAGAAPATAPAPAPAGTTTTAPQ